MAFSFLERDLEDIISSSSSKEIRKRGLIVYDHNIVCRQVNLGVYGVADLIGITIKNYGSGNRFITITIYELKQGTIDEKAFFQAVRYLNGLKHFISDNFNVNVEHIHFNIVLVGDKMKIDGDFAFVCGTFHNLRLFTYSIKLDGLFFKEELNYKSVNNTLPDHLRSRIKEVSKMLIKNIK